MRLFPRVRITLERMAILGVLVPGNPTPGAAADSPLPPGGPPDPPWALLEIELPGPASGSLLRELDLDVLAVRSGRSARILARSDTQANLAARGVSVRVVSADYGRDLAVQNGVSPRSAPPGTSRRGVLPLAVPPLAQGSLAGFWTLDEVTAILDSLAAVHAGSRVTGIDTIGWSVQGRPILALGVTDLSRPLGTRPEVFYTSLTHAREPQGMQSLMYYLLRLLGEADTDPELGYLLHEREQWFVPVVNPDGYLRNQATWESSGSYGFWRKNLRNNDQNPSIGNNDGVDLNRNFGYQWGYDDLGSSPNIASPTYRGPSPFSEPETQALRDFCLAHGFRTAQNFHSFWELCLYSWGYVSADTPDADAFIRLADAMSEAPRYGYGRSGQVLYPVNGEANDWMYGDPGKPSILAFTTEVGDQTDGFWPPPSRILPLAEAQFRGNVVLAYAASVYLTADSLSVDGPGGILNPGEVRPIHAYLRHDGVADETEGNPRLRASSATPGVVVLQDACQFPMLSPGEGSWPVPGDAFLLRAAPWVVPGTVVQLDFEIEDEGAYRGRDLLAFRIGEPLVLFTDDGEGGLGNWTPGGSWGLQSEAGNTFFSDSPAGPYAPSGNTTFTLNQALDLSGASAAVLRFRARWDLEMGYDFALVEASLDSGSTWTALPGAHTRGGHGSSGAYAGGVQPAGVPGYDGNQRFWEAEEIDLASYAGASDVRLRFRLAADGGAQLDGWHLDDVTILGYAPLAPLDVPPGRTAPGLALSVAPNPLVGRARIGWSLDVPVPVRVAVHDLRGREVRVLTTGLPGTGPREVIWDGRDAAGRLVASGAYFVRLETPRESRTTKLFVVR